MSQGQIKNIRELPKQRTETRFEDLKRVPSLGQSHQLSLGYLIEKKEKENTIKKHHISPNGSFPS